MTVTTTALPTPPTGPGDPAEYAIAAALATAAEQLADAVDDNRPDWLEIAIKVGDLLDALVIIRIDGETDWNAVLADIYANSGKPRPADPADQTGELFDAEPYRRNHQ